MTTCRATASAPPPRSSARAPTAIRPPAPTTSSRPWCRPSSPSSSASSSRLCSHPAATCAADGEENALARVAAQPGRLLLAQRCRRRAVGDGPQLLGHPPPIGGGAQLPEDGVQTQVDALDD